MAELLAAVSSAVAAQGVRTIEHHGYLSEVAEPNTRFVVVPHEYFAVSPPEAPDLYARTVGFGVEQPGTQTFEASVESTARLGARVEISEESVAELRRRSLPASHFQLGYASAWDVRAGQPVVRDVDVLYLGTADERRCSLLAGYATDLAGLRTELLIPPHEPMTKDRPDFLSGSAKWSLLARSKVIINLHREDKQAFEWVRGLEAMINGCVVVSEPSTDMGPMVAGRHLLIAPPERLGNVARATVRAQDTRTSIAACAYRFVSEELDMAGSARELIRLAQGLAAPSHSPKEPGPRFTSRETARADTPMAVWIPSSESMPAHGPQTDTWVGRQLALLTTLADRQSPQMFVALPASSAGVGVICVDSEADGSIGATQASLGSKGTGQPSTAFHVASVDPGIDTVTPPNTSYATHLTSALPMSRGRLRNLLVSSSANDLLLVLDAGDRVLPGTLRQMTERMAVEPELDVVFCMATYGQRSLANALIPEIRRLRVRPYLTRGYLVRRRWLDYLGGFTQDPYLQDYLDHDFWLRTSIHQGRVELIRAIGIQLSPSRNRRGIADFDPEAVRRAIAQVAIPTTCP